MCFFLCSFFLGLEVEAEMEIGRNLYFYTHSLGEFDYSFLVMVTSLDLRLLFLKSSLARHYCLRNKQSMWFTTLCNIEWDVLSFGLPLATGYYRRQNNCFFPLLLYLLVLTYLWTERIRIRDAMKLTMQEFVSLIHFNWTTNTNRGWSRLRPMFDIGKNRCL